ncbi:hypothetical protein ISE1_2390 [plant metagenome]|uniref:Uncharacterized protein n=1 Tax=plant metagenome TaxID=1297885 RepID=A0A484TJR9_9ZZZZ
MISRIGFVGYVWAIAVLESANAEAVAKVMANFMMEPLV